MGCWNETCMLSHTPIFSGDRVYAGLVAMRVTGFNASYPDGLFMPVAPLVEARYDDYGRPEFVKCPDAVMDIYKALRCECRSRDGDLKPFDQNANAACDDEVMQELFDAARHDGLFVIASGLDGSVEKRPVFPVMILGRFWDLAQDAIKKKDLCLSGPLKEDIGFRVRLPELFREAVREGRLDEPGTLVPHLKLQCFMDRCRIPWHFACGSGSQEGFTPQMAKLAKEVVRYRNDLRNEYGE